MQSRNSGTTIPPSIAKRGNRQDATTTITKLHTRRPPNSDRRRPNSDKGSTPRSIETVNSQVYFLEEIGCEADADNLCNQVSNDECRDATVSCFRVFSDIEPQIYSVYMKRRRGKHAKPYKTALGNGRA